VRTKAGKFDKLAAERAFAAWVAGESTVSAKDKGGFDKEAAERAFEAWAHGHGWDEKDESGKGISAAHRSKTFSGRIKSFSPGKNKNGIFEFWHKLSSVEQDKATLNALNAALASESGSSGSQIASTGGSATAAASGGAKPSNTRRLSGKQRSVLNVSSFQAPSTTKTPSDPTNLSQSNLATSLSTPAVSSPERAAASASNSSPALVNNSENNKEKKKSFSPFHKSSSSMIPPPTITTTSPSSPVKEAATTDTLSPRASGHQRKKSLPGLFSATISGATNPLGGGKKDRKESLKKIDFFGDDVGSPGHMLSLARTTSSSTVDSR